MRMIEIRPVNPVFAAREFVRWDRIAQFYLEVDGGWNALLDDGTPCAIHPNSVARLEAELRADNEYSVNLESE